MLKVSHRIGFQRTRLIGFQTSFVKIRCRFGVCFDHILTTKTNSVFTTLFHKLDEFCARHEPTQKKPMELQSSQQTRRCLFDVTFHLCKERCKTLQGSWRSVEPSIPGARFQHCKIPVSRWNTRALHVSVLFIVHQQPLGVEFYTMIV